MTNKDYSVLSIIVAFNGAEWIERCLGSVLKSDYPSDIIVIDNNSTDDTCTIIQNNFPDVDLISLKENIGFGQANNLGLRKMRDKQYDYAFLLNQDAWIKPDTIMKLVSAQLKSPNFGVISPMHLNSDGSKLELLFSQFIQPEKCPSLYSDIYCQSIRDAIYKCEFVNAAAWLISKDCIERIGGFSPIFYHYGEDDNYCMRMHHHGVELGIYPLTEIYHAKENYSSKYDTESELEKRRRVVLYSDPKRYKIIDNDIHINKMSKLKSLLKLNFTDFHKFKNHENYLIKLKQRIKPHVNASLKEGPNFIS